MSRWGIEAPLYKQIRAELVCLCGAMTGAHTQKPSLTSNYRECCYCVAMAAQLSGWVMQTAGEAE